jgi:hypothetical protein
MAIAEAMATVVVTDIAEPMAIVAAHTMAGKRIGAG